MQDGTTDRRVLAERIINELNGFSTRMFAFAVIFICFNLSIPYYVYTHKFEFVGVYYYISQVSALISTIYIFYAIVKYSNLANYKSSVIEQQSLLPVVFQDNMLFNEYLSSIPSPFREMYRRSSNKSLEHKVVEFTHNLDWFINPSRVFIPPVIVMIPPIILIVVLLVVYSNTTVAIPVLAVTIAILSSVSTAALANIIIGKLTNSQAIKRVVLKMQHELDN